MSGDATARRRLLAAGAALLLAGHAAHTAAPAAAAEGRGTLNAALENDRIANTDRHFTHGSYVSYVTAHGGAPDWARDLGAALAQPLLGRGTDRVGFALGQNIFTPDDIATFDPIADDRPYAGWLYGGLRLIGEQPRGLQRLELDVGMVGPSARADDVQAVVHDVIGTQRPNGWDNQLDDEPGVLLLYERKWRRIDAIAGTGLEVALTPHAVAALGNVYTFAGGGASLAIGQRLAASWGPERIFPGIRGSEFFDAGGGVSWRLFAGGEVRAVARNIFLDGNTFAGGPGVDREPIVADLQVGAEIIYARYRIAFTQVIRTREFASQTEPDRFGAITLSVQF